MADIPSNELPDITLNFDVDIDEITGEADLCTQIGNYTIFLGTYPTEEGANEIIDALVERECNIIH